MSEPWWVVEAQGRHRPSGWNDPRYPDGLLTLGWEGGLHVAVPFSEVQAAHQSDECFHASLRSGQHLGVLETDANLDALIELLARNMRPEKAGG